MIPVDRPQVVLEHHAVAIAGGHIHELLPLAEARDRYPGARRTELPSHALIPGLINLHTHAAMTLMRGLADDRALMDWLQDHIWPAETRLYRRNSSMTAPCSPARKCCVGGVTCFNDMYFFPEAAAQAALASGHARHHRHHRDRIALSPTRPTPATT